LLDKLALNKILFHNIEFW